MARKFEEIAESFAEKRKRDKFKRLVAGIKEDVKVEKELAKNGTKTKSRSIVLLNRKLLKKAKRPTAVFDLGQRQQKSEPVSPFSGMIGEERGNLFFKF